MTPTPIPRSQQVAKAGALLLGAQISPQLQLDELLALPLDRHAWAGAVRRCQQAASYAVAYQPEPGRASYGGRFTAAVELVRRGGVGRGGAGRGQRGWGAARTEPPPCIGHA